MGKRNNHLFVKILLVLVAELVAMTLTQLFSMYIRPVDNPIIVNVIGGAILAIIVVVLYNKMMERRKKKVEQELQDITKVVLKKIPEDPNDINKDEER